MFDTTVILNNIKGLYTNMCDKVKNSTITLYAYYAITWYTKNMEKAKRIGRKLCADYPLLKNVIDRIIYSLQYVKAITTNQLIEPMSSNWISTTVLLSRDPNKFIGDVYTYREFYEFFIDDVESNYSELFQEADTSMEAIVSSTKSINQGMVMMKNNDKYIIRIHLDGDDAKNIPTFPPVETKKSFINVTYTHPIMKEPIFMTIGKEFFYENNEILAPIFIKRYLEHQPLNYHFDMDYIIKIMDNDLKVFELTSNQFIRLGESDYSVVEYFHQ